MNNPILRVENLSVLLKDNKRKILSDISFEVNQNDVLALMGFNGCGKSTILRAIAGTMMKGHKCDYEIISGSIYFCGENILNFNNKKLEDYRLKIAYIKQEDRYFPGATVGMLVEDRLSAVGLKMTEKEIKQSINDFFPKDDDNTVTFDSEPEKLSGGQKKLLSIFLETISKPNASLYLIDEPLNNLDFKIAGMVSNLINKIHLQNRNSAIILVTHCRIITCINRAIELKKGLIVNNNAKYECHNCYGYADECGMYEK